MSVLALIGTGITLGIVHVLTGPDHLSALATLTASRSSFQSWWLGIRWGVGHSTGLVVVGSILIFLQHESAEEHIQVPKPVMVALESCVGVFMLGLGTYGVIQAVRRRRQDFEEDEEAFPSSTNNVEMGAASLSMADVGVAAAPISQGTGVDASVDVDRIKAQPLHVVEKGSHSDSVVDAEQANLVEESQDDTVVDVMEQTQAEPIAEKSLEEEQDRNKARPKCSTGLLALLAGIVHGLAGPGGVLGVIPAVQVKDPFLGGLYLGTFCITSTLTMGCFAALYGTVTKKLGEYGGDKKRLWEFRIQLVSASLTIIVGILWLILLSIGKLQDVFG